MTQALKEQSTTIAANQVHLFGKKRVTHKLPEVCVIVPVRNEAVHLYDTLEALRRQTDANNKPLSPGTYEVLLLANNCSDQSAKVAIDYQKKFPDFLLYVEIIQLPSSKANIGTVRRLLMDEAYRRLNESGNANGIIASTDGDTIVDTKWVYNIILEINKGIDAVGGRILTKSNDSPVRLYHLRDVMYRSMIAKAEAILDPSLHDPWPRHFQYFGASLAVTCNMYERAGRLPEVPFLEDNAFYQALKCVDAKVRKSVDVKVYTSTRTAGRVEVGFSEQLHKWSFLSKNSETQFVEPAESLLIKFKNRFALRTCWNYFKKTGKYSDGIVPVAHALFLDSAKLKKQLAECNYFGKLWQQVEKEMDNGKWGRTWKPVPILQAIAELRLFTSGQTK